MKSPRPFDAPWQAQAFAMVLALHERGAFTWPEWAEALSHAISTAQAEGDPDDGSTYYNHWLTALEKLCIAKQLTNSEQLHALEHAWLNAAQRTPHGQPIELTASERALAFTNCPGLTRHDPGLTQGSTP